MKQFIACSSDLDQIIQGGRQISLFLSSFLYYHDQYSLYLLVPTAQICWNENNARDGCVSAKGLRENECALSQDLCDIQIQTTSHKDRTFKVPFKSQFYYSDKYEILTANKNMNLMHFCAKFMALKDILQAVTPKDHNGFVFKEKCLQSTSYQIYFM